MKLVVAFVVLVYVCLVAARSKAQKKKDYVFTNEYSQAEVYPDQHSHQIQHSSSVSSNKGGYSAGSGLRSIAQGSADQANSAVANQHSAGKQAAYIAKNTLAQTAVQASATAQAALAGKQVLLQELEQQNLEAHQALEAEIQQLLLAKRSAKAAQQSAQQALEHVSVLQSALNSAQASAVHAQEAASETAAELASQSAMVGKAKAKVQALEEQLHRAQIDFEATQAAAHKAAQAAHEAQSNASEAAAHAESSNLQAQSGYAISSNDGHGESSHGEHIETVANHNYEGQQESEQYHY